MNDYAYGYCGMPCALCTRYRTNGKSACPGCSYDGYYTDACKVYRCCREKRLNHCGGCDAFPCVRLGKMGDFRDLNTGHVKQRTCGIVASEGFDVWYAEYTRRADMLTSLLERCNDGRSKRFLCELFIQKDFDVLCRLTQKAEALNGTPKENAAALRAIVSELCDDDDINTASN